MYLRFPVIKVQTRRSKVENESLFSRKDSLLKTNESFYKSSTIKSIDSGSSKPQSNIQKALSKKFSLLTGYTRDDEIQDPYNCPVFKVSFLSSDDIQTTLRLGNNLENIENDPVTYIPLASYDSSRKWIKRGVALICDIHS